MAGIEAAPSELYHGTGTSGCLRPFRRDNAVGCLAEELCRLNRPYLKRPILSFLGSAGLAVFFEGSLAVRSERTKPAGRIEVG
jgi:hypothetical protein